MRRWLPWVAVPVIGFLAAACDGLTDDGDSGSNNGAVTVSEDCTNGECPPPDDCTNGDCPTQQGEHCCCSWNQGREFCCCKKANDICCNMLVPALGEYCFAPGNKKCEPPSWWPDWLGDDKWPSGVGCGFWAQVEKCGS